VSRPADRTRPGPLAVLVRLAGGDPARVLPLARALDRQATGERHWQHAREGGGSLGPDAGRYLTLAVLVLISGGLAVLVHAQAGRPAWWPALVLLLSQFGAVTLTMARDAVPLLLADEDRQVIGWWPVSERDLLLARGGLLLRGVLQVTLAVAGLPLLVLMSQGQPVLVAGLGALVGLGLHALLLTALLALGLQGLSRLVGHRWARRLVEILGVLVLLVLINLGGRPQLRLLAVDEPQTSWALLAYPLFWFAAWAALWPPAAVHLVATVLAVAVSLVAVAAGLRRLGSPVQADRQQAAAALRRVRDWTGPLIAWTRPWLTGTDGQVLQLLLRAHLRADWRLTGQLFFYPPLYLCGLWIWTERRLQTAGSEVPAASLLAIDLGLFAALLGVSLGAALTFSGEAAAAWPVQGGLSSGRRLLSLHRRLLRVLVAAPFLLAAAVLLLLRGDLSPGQAPAVVAVAWLVFELLVALVQWFLPAVPFSRAWRRDEHPGRQVFWLILVIWVVHGLWQGIVLPRLGWGLVETLACLVALLAVVRWSLGRRVQRRGVYGVCPRRT
jgi:hypothetical protein